jgi:hypothetical protein
MVSNTPHIITEADFATYTNETILAGDSARGKKLVSRMYFNNMSEHPLATVKFEVYDLRLEEDKQLVKITWSLRKAIEVYNKLL